MRIYQNISAFKKINNSVVTIGTFDGVHLGHKIVIEQLKKAAKKINGETIILTFFPHPRMVLYPDDNELRLLNTIDERVEMLTKAGIDHLIIHPFSKEFSKISSIDFIRNILIDKIGLAKLIIGHDHHFGRNREGTYESLQELAPLYDFDVEEIPAQEIQHVNISSTKIRTSLTIGEINSATHFLGYNYSINGTVIEGRKIGRKIGFPTANISVDEWYKLIPKQGVYAVKLFVDEVEYKGMLNIGNRPTLNGEEQTIEVHIFDFDANIYKKKIKVAFCKRIRDEQKFNDINALQQQLIIDKKESIQAFSDL